MISIAFRNESTGIISILAPPGDDIVVKKLVGVLVDNSIAKDVILKQIDQYVFVADSSFKFTDVNGEKHSLVADYEYVIGIIDQIYASMNQQMRGYADLSHDIQYFSGAALQFSTIAGTAEPSYEELRDRLDDINNLSTLYLAKGTYYRYITEELEDGKHTSFNLVDKLQRVAKGAAYLGKHFDKSVEFDLRLPERLVVRGIDLIDFVFVTIIENAVKYGPPERVRITISLTYRDKSAIVSVAGPGLLVEEHEKTEIFKQGYRGRHPIKARISGLGLGLFQAQAGAYSLVGGSIKFRQSPPSDEIDGNIYYHTTVSVLIPMNDLSLRSTRPL